MNDIPVPAIGRPLDRADGFLKVTGGARYSAEWPIENVTHGVLVRANIPRGKITAIDSRAAAAVPGVVEIFTHLNPPPLEQTSAFSNEDDERGSMSMSLRPLSGPEIFYNGQYIALVVARTLEQAREAAGRLRFTYDVTPPDLELRGGGQPDRAPVVMVDELGHAQPPKKVRDDPPDRKHGDAEPALAAAPVKFEARYTTPWETHNPMEPHATIASWEGDRLTVYDATQNVTGLRKMLAIAFAIPLENVRVISKFVGGAFGSKGLAWPHVPLTVAAARAVRLPVKVALHRHDMFMNVGYRSPTVQKLQLGVSAAGELASIIHSGVSQVGVKEAYAEPFTDPTSNIYGTPNILLSQRVVSLNVCRPTFMRAPGEAPGMFALESALDELAWELKVDPIELRLRNDAAVSPLKQLPYSTRALRQCLELAAEKFGWKNRAPQPGAQRQSGLLVGYGMASSIYPANRSGAKAKLTLRADGTALAQSATHELGTGTYTALAQFLAELLGMPAERVRFDLGDSLFPESPVAGGSQSINSVGAALQAAVAVAAEELVKLGGADPASPLHGVSPTSVRLHGGRVFVTGDPARSDSVSAILARAGKEQLEVVGTAKPQDEKKKFAMHAFGAHFCEVHVDPDLGTTRVARWVSAHACGRILNEKTARSQIHGGIIMGIGMALMEETVLDARWGRIMTDDLADYHVPVHADIPAIESYFVPEVDDIASPIGTKGVGEIGIVGAPAAIANAIYHATGKRLRDLPFTPDKLLG